MQTVTSTEQSFQEPTITIGFPNSTRSSSISNLAIPAVSTQQMQSPSIASPTKTSASLNNLQDANDFDIFPELNDLESKIKDVDNDEAMTGLLPINAIEAKQKLNELEVTIL